MRKRAIVKLMAVAFALSLVPLINGCSEQATTSPGPVSLQDTSPPAPPVCLDSQGRETGITLKWSPNVEPDLIGYNVYLYSPNPDRNESFLKLNDGPISNTEFRRNNLTPNTDMFFRLTAVDQSGNESGFSSLLKASTVTFQLKQN